MTAKMTLEEIEGLAKNATPAPWIVRDDGHAYAMPIIDSPHVGNGYFASIATVTQRDKNPQHGGEVKLETAEANAALIVQVWRLLEIAREQRETIRKLQQFSCEACADADSCDRVGRSANRQCAAFRVGTKK